MYKLLPILLLFSFGLHAQTPQKVERITQEMRHVDWYKNQIKAWEKVVDKQPQNGDAWLNYYWATRVAGQVGGGPWPQKAMEAVVSKLEKAMPNSFEYYYLSAFTNSADFEGKFEMLKKAYAADPSRVELNEEFALQYEIKRNLTKRKEFNIKWYQSNIISPHLLAINYNVLMSLEDDAIIYTNGDNDTMPLWLLQDALGVKPDVTVINVSLINLPDYRVKLLKSLGVSEEKSKSMKLDVPSMLAFFDKETQLSQHLVLTLRESFYEDVKSDLYMVGLSSKYSKRRFDNLSTLAKNVEEHFNMNHLDDFFTYLSPQSTVKHHMGTYLAPLMRLQRYYSEKGLSDKAKNIQQTLLKVAKRCGRSEEVEKWLSE
ncbi:MAG: hypothetical protein AAF696_12115 [Bacteroidota bacterium]